MANEELIEKPKQQPEEKVAEDKPKKFNSKILIIGLPAFVVQLIIVYFVTANLLLSKIVHSESTNPGLNRVDSTGLPAAPDTKNHKDLGKYIFQIEDVIVNPADTEGKRLLLTSIGFDLGEELQMQEFKSKEVLLKDVIVTTLSGKTLAQLSSTTFKDSIKSEIFTRVKTLLPASKLNTVYISKYIIQ